MIKRGIYEGVKSVIFGWNGVTVTGVGSATTLLPNVIDTVTQMKDQYGVKIGSTANCSREQLNLLLDKSKEEGYTPDSSVSADEVKYDVGPYMIYRNLELLNVYPLDYTIKVDNNVEGIKEGLSAKCWTVAVADNRDYINNGLYPIDIEEFIEKSKESLAESNPHYVINSIVDMPKVLDDINERLQFGEYPCVNEETYLLKNNKFVDSDEYFEDKDKRYCRNMFLL